MIADARSASEHGSGASRVFVCDDLPEIRDALSGALDHLPGFAKVGEAGDGMSCIRGVQRDCPDVLILDVGMPDSGPDLVRAVKSIAPDVRIVVFTAYDHDDVRESMLSAGADEYVVKTGRLRPLRDALLRVARRTEEGL